MTTDPNKIFQVRYKIETKLFTEDGKNEIIPIRISTLSWRVDYSMSFTPMITLILQLIPAHINIIKNNENTILLSMKMTKVKYQSSMEDMTNRIPVESEIVFDTIFVPIVETDDIINLKEFSESTEESGIEDQYIGGNDGRLNIYNVRFYINTLNYHLMYKRTFNAVLRNKSNKDVTVDTALKFIAETADIKGYIMDTPDNKIPYPNIIIPPGNVKYVIDSLQILYGIYLYDILSFYDIDEKMYILSRLSKTHDYEKGKIKKTVLQVSPANDVERIGNGTVIYDNDDTIFHTMIKNLEDNSNNISEGEAFGDTIVFTNYGFSSESFKYKNDKVDEINPSTREYIRNAISHSKTSKGISFEYDELNNYYNMFSNLNTLGITNIFTAKTEGMDINCLKPNVMYNIQIAGNERDNLRFKNKDLNLLGFTQEFYRDNDSGEYDVFKTFEILMLAFCKK